MVEALLLIPPRGKHIGGVRPVEPSLAPIAVGLWVSTMLVLVLPSPGFEKHRVREEDLLRAHGVAMTTFALL